MGCEKVKIDQKAKINIWRKIPKKSKSDKVQYKVIDWFVFVGFDLFF